MLAGFGIQQDSGAFELRHRALQLSRETHSPFRNLVDDSHTSGFPGPGIDQDFTNHRVGRSVNGRSWRQPAGVEPGLL